MPEYLTVVRWEGALCVEVTASEIDWSEPGIRGVCGGLVLGLCAIDDPEKHLCSDLRGPARPAPWSAVDAKDVSAEVIATVEAAWGEGTFLVRRYLPRYHVVALSVWADDPHARRASFETLRECLFVASMGEDPDVIVDDDGELACLAGEELGAGGCGCPKCDGPGCPCVKCTEPATGVDPELGPVCDACAKYLTAISR
jgi:hypothetical protein